MITRAQMQRQLRNKGGIMTVKTIRQKYGIGDIVGDIGNFIRKIIPNEVAKVAEVAAPIAAIVNPALAPYAALAGGLGRYDRTGDLKSSALYGGGIQLAGAASPGFGKFAGETTFGSGVTKNILLGKEGGKGLFKDKGLLGAAGKFGLGEAIGKGTPGIFLGTTALALLGQKLVGPKKEDETEEEYLQRRKTAVSGYLRRYYSNLNPTASATDVEAFVQRNTVDYKAEGGIMEVPVRTNSEGVKELDMRKTGGFVPIGVKEKADDVPAMLSKNEFVMTADAVRAAGGGSIEKGAQRMYDTMKKLESRVA